MVMPDVPTGSIATLPDQELLWLFDSWGRYSKVAVRRALALLPEIVRRGLHRRAGFESEYEFARKKAGISNDVVNKVFRLHEQIGHMPELWNLLASGDEGWTKLAVVQPLARVDNAADLAAMVRRCSKAELEEYVRRVKEREGMKRQSQLPLPDRAPGCPPADAGEPASGVADVERAASRQSSLAGNQDFANEGDPPLEPSAEAPSGASNNLDLGSAERAPTESSSVGSVGIPGLPGENGLASTRSGTGTGQRGLRGVTLYLRPEDQALLLAYQAQYRRERGETLSLGEIVGLLLRGEWPGQSTPERSSGGADPLPDLGRAETLGPQAWAEGATESEEGKPGDAPTVSASDSTGSVAGPLGPVAQMAARRTVEVVVRVAELGSGWLKGFSGILPVGIADTFKTREAIGLGDLYLRAVKAATRCQSERIPRPVRKFVALRAQFLCEVPGCERFVHDLHHEKALSEGGTHHPDNVMALCQLHHGMRHKDLFADLAAGVPVGPADRVRPTPANVGFRTTLARILASSP